jgi:hypothetical protein
MRRSLFRALAVATIAASPAAAQNAVGADTTHVAARAARGAVRSATQLAVPEPASLALTALGLLALGGALWRVRRA